MPDPTGRISHTELFHRGQAWKLPVRCATTASVTISTALNNGDTLDGVTLATGDRVLVKNQSTGSQNGIYIAGATPARAPDMDQDQTTSVPAEEVLGAIVHVLAGTANGGTFWRNTNTTTPVLGTTALTWAQFAAFVNPMTTAADLIVGGTSGAPARLAKGSDGQVLTVDPTTHLLVWATPSSGFSDPMTTRGDIIVRNASNVTARLGRGSAGQVFSSDGTDVSWQTPSGGGTGLLGATMYSTGSDTAWASTSSGTNPSADIDATNAAITVTIPASGAIVAMVSLDWTCTVANSGGWLSLRTGSTDLQYSSLITGNVAAGGIAGLSVAGGHAHAMFYVTGLTPGSLTLKVGFRRGGSSTLQVYANDASGAGGHLAGPFVMTVWAA